MAEVTNSKWKEIWSNPSAYITLTLILLGFLKSIGLSVDVTNDGNVDVNDATVLIDSVWQKHLADILGFLAPIIIGIFGKISKIKITKKDIVAYITTSNFITAIFSLLTLILGVFLGKELVTVIIITIANILNFVYHLNIPVTTTVVTVSPINIELVDDNNAKHQ